MRIDPLTRWVSRIFVGVLAVTTIGCAEQRLTFDGDSQEYLSVEELAAASYVVVQAQRGDLVARELDQGEAPSDERDESLADPGIPMAFYEFHVASVLRGTLDDDVIVVGLLDTDRVTEESMRPVPEGAETVLFLLALSADETPGITSVGDHYAPVSGETGIFDLDDDVATPRDDRLTRLTRNGDAAARSDTPGFGMQDVRATITGSGE